MGGRTMPYECPHGVVLDWGDFGPDPEDGSVGIGNCAECRADQSADREWWMDFPRTWLDVVLIAVLCATFVALCFAPAASCSITSTDDTTTTTAATKETP